MSVTIKDLARAAGVSVATISRALNNKGPVSDPVRERILSLSAEMHYVPHGAARSLVTTRTNTIGVLLPDICGEFFSELIRGIDLAARRHGYHLLVSGSHGDRAEAAAVLQATRGRVDGLIVMSPDIDGDTLRATLPDSLPIVLLNSPSRDEEYDSIRVDNYGGAFAMVRHLVDLGYRRIAHVGGPAANHDAQERLRGYREALEALGAEHQAELEVNGEFTETGGYQAGKHLLSMSPRPQAVFAANDVTAVGVLCAFTEAGVRVPEDIAVTGFDDIPIARYITPPLTSVQVPIETLGTRALERLLLAIDLKNHHERVREVLPATLMVRQSCGANTGTTRPMRRATPRRRTP
ncbi:MAG TPA: LacI family DNA-binding transcriptional regulator [Thermoanaerobaculaceae bacterium]|nr:LacI family DNA-binding transcriptional regulator [Thermoanaerobaculaceae bacterium]